MPIRKGQRIALETDTDRTELIKHGPAGKANSDAQEPQRRASALRETIQEASKGMGPHNGTWEDFHDR